MNYYIFFKVQQSMQKKARVLMTMIYQQINLSSLTSTVNNLIHTSLNDIIPHPIFTETFAYKSFIQKTPQDQNTLHIDMNFIIYSQNNVFKKFFQFSVSEE